VVKIDQFLDIRKWHDFQLRRKVALETKRNPEVPLITEYIWHEAYKAAILETDWTKIQERLQIAESEIRKRQHVFSMDHGGTPEERQAIAEALRGMESLREEVTNWQNRQASDDAPVTTD
jgi:hypothetical protein